MNSIAVRIGATIVAIFVCAMALTALLNLHKFSALFTEVVEDRLKFAIEDIKVSVEAGLSLGVPLGALGRTQEILEQNLKQDTAILSIEVFNRDGEVVFGTDRGFIGDLVSERWLEVWKRSPGRIWTMTESDALVVGANLSTSVGDSAGGVAVRYARAALAGPVDHARFALIRLGAILTAITAGLALGGVWLVLRPTHSSLLRMEVAAEAAVRGDPVEFSPRPDVAIEQAFAGFLGSAAGAMTGIGTAAARIRDLDESE